MKVLFVNTSVRTGGAAVAAGRLMRALQGIGVEVELCVRPSGYRARLCFLWERLCIWVANGFSRRNLFAVDIANAGVDITKSAEFREADIIHLHWVNQGFLSMRSLRKIVQSGKPIVWTLHDMWACTAICHHARNCEAFHTQCGAWCSPHGQLPSGWKSKFADTAESGLSGGKTVCGDTPLTERVWRQKEELYRDANITFVSCSQWLDGKVALSALTKDKPHISIPNPIDTALFKPSPRHEGGEHSLRILFGACNIADKRKGIDYFVESLNILAANYPEMKEEIVIVLFGHGGEQFASLPPSSLSSKVSATSRLLPFKIEDRGYVESDEEMVRIYQSATLYITPSLEENLPNTVMEAMSCGVPCVSFAVGGLPEMIDHKENGYLAKYEDAEDLARGLAYILTHHDRDILCANAHNKVMTHYEQSLIANRYKTLYDQCLHSQ